MKTRSRQIVGELDLIEHIREQFPGRTKRVSLGIGDDCAILRVPAGHEVLVTTDFSLEGRHFRRDLHPPESVGHRCLARGLSDLAAMGATPTGAFLSLALPRTMVASGWGRAWLDRFFKSMGTLAEEHGVTLAGGDTSESPGGQQGLILADIVLIGSARQGKALRRAGASAGDALYVTGSLGGAAAELGNVLKSRRRVRAVSSGDHPHLFPKPRLEVGKTLLRRGLATACLDISDGLSTDLAHLCRASNVSSEVDEAALPIHPLARRLSAPDALKSALHGGEDYELLFTAPASARMPRSIAGVPITRIGSMIRSRRPLITLKEPNGARMELEAAGWEHFGGGAGAKKRAR